MFFRVQVFQSPGSTCFRVKVIRGPGFSGFTFFRVRVQGPGPSIRSSLLIKHKNVQSNVQCHWGFLTFIQYIMTCKCLKSCLWFWTRLKCYSSSLPKHMSEFDSYSVSLISSSSSFMQTDSIDMGISPSNDWILYFPSTKFHPKFSGKDGIIFELKALYHQGSLSGIPYVINKCCSQNLLL